MITKFPVLWQPCKRLKCFFSKRIFITPFRIWYTQVLNQNKIYFGVLREVEYILTLTYQCIEYFLFFSLPFVWHALPVASFYLIKCLKSHEKNISHFYILEFFKGHVKPQSFNLLDYISLSWISKCSDRGKNKIKLGSKIYDVFVHPFYCWSIMKFYISCRHKIWLDVSMWSLHWTFR